MNKEVRFKSVVAASLLKFDSLDNVDISLILEDLKKLSFYIRDIFLLKEQEMEKTREEKPRQRNFVKRKRNQKDKKRK